MWASNVRMLNCSVRSDFLWPHGLQPTRLFCPLNFPGKNTGVGCHFVLQGIFPTQGLKLCLFSLLHWLVGSLPLWHLRSQPEFPVTKHNRKQYLHVHALWTGLFCWEPGVLATFSLKFSCSSEFVSHSIKYSCQIKLYEFSFDNRHSYSIRETFSETGCHYRSEKTHMGN